MSPPPPVHPDETARVARIGIDLARRRWCAALDRAFRLPGLPVLDEHDGARRLAVIAHTLACAGRVSGARHYAALAHLALPDDDQVRRITAGVAALPRAGRDRAEPVEPVPRRAPCVHGIGPDTARAVGRAEQALAWLDHTATRSPHADAWARLMSWREARDSARLDGVHAALLEFLRHDLAPSGNHLVFADRVLAPYLTPTAAASTRSPPIDLVDIACRHVHRSPTTPHPHRTALAADLSRHLSGRWLPILGALADQDAAVPAGTASEAERFTRLIAEATAAACHTAVTVLHDLEHLHRRLATRLPTGRLSHLALRDLLTHGLITASGLARRHPMSAKSAHNILDRFLDLGLAVPYDHRRYARAVYNPDLIDLLTRTPEHP
ncbi:hypothetical protein GCM10022243_37240 [Saccharothrix violaceirubra]|uniref:Uncharacterized protein n=1 Tax=Saccharothrix violaceirubra TaxID=413306 RepID=A0A7W7WWR0_9PSEU|nr:hypothetical protein [Saccharothrix violaceirubra]MBB4966361.1 hypothetical protein [Saccharothrix violaceirubra]